MSRVPRIRFKGFEEDWEQRKLGECFTERIESMPNGELISVTINDGIKKFSELGRHDNSNEDKSKYKKVCIGDIAYNSMRMWQGASGYSPYNGIVSPAYTVLLANEGVNSKCIAYQFKLPGMIHAFQINSQGITSDNWNLKFQALSDITIYISRSIDEQGKIAVLLESLDHLITLHQRKLEKLKIIKKSMLENLFPQNGEKTPKIRFSGFTKDWEQCKLGEIIQERNIRTSDFDRFPIFSLTIESGITPKTERYERSSLVTKTEDLFKVVKPNEFVTNPMNLRFGALGYNAQKYDVSVSGYYDVFSIDGNNCSGFWNAYFKTHHVMNIFDNVATGSLVEKKRVKYSTIKQIYLSVPTNIEEKNKISKFMILTNHLITLHQRKLDKLQKIKKSMLESMFV
ncbi:restriction endonuclease subunit S [Lachnoanaerobaculum orale]|uniref:restriction endonuclease subunit S n=1 Tax=Lachnoanaerobaculum orale TaxID=979627 RepID=UPI0023A8F7FD|nr:restriction endonuclease subunit S [Lachnoanaerobaculum orale]